MLEWDIEVLLIRIFDMEVIAMHPIHLDGLDVEEAPDAFVFVDDIIPWLEFLVRP